MPRPRSSTPASSLGAALVPLAAAASTPPRRDVPRRRRAEVARSRPLVRRRRARRGHCVHPRQCWRTRSPPLPSRATALASVAAPTPLVTRPSKDLRRRAVTPPPSDSRRAAAVVGAPPSSSASPCAVTSAAAAASCAARALAGFAARGSTSWYLLVTEL